MTTPTYRLRLAGPTWRYACDPGPLRVVREDQRGLVVESAGEGTAANRVRYLVAAESLTREEPADAP